MKDYDWMEEARGIAAQCWKHDDTKNIEMDSRLAEHFALQLGAWIRTAEQESRNRDYYRRLLVKCGESIGKQAYIQDDGGVVTDVLVAKIPELVEKLVQKNAELSVAN